MNTQLRYDTSNIPIKERFAFWNDAVCSTYVQLGCDSDQKDDFNGSIDLARHSKLSISTVKGRSQLVRRRKCDIQLATEASFLISLQVEKKCQVSQLGHTAVLMPGDMALYCSSEPYELQLADDFTQMVVQLPTEKLIARLPNAEMMAARKIDGQSGIGRLVQENIIAFSGFVNSATPALQEMLQETLIDLVATGIASQHTEVLNLCSLKRSIMLRAKAFISNNLGNPELNRNAVAASLGVSVRYLNAIFSADSESLSAYIRRMRFESVASELRDCRYNSSSISQIAYKYGFENMQHFSTAFRSHFGLAPREYRALGAI